MSAEVRPGCREGATTGFPSGLVLDDGDRPAAPSGAELHDAGARREDRVIAADADAVTGAEARAALPHDDLAAAHQLPREHLHPEHLRVGVAPLRLEPSPFLRAIAGLLRLLGGRLPGAARGPGRLPREHLQVGDLEAGELGAMTRAPPIALLRPVLEDPDLRAALMT